MTINSSPSDLNVKQVLDELLKIYNLPNQHSGPTKRAEIMLSDGNKTIKFQLSRDSEYETQYWIGINNYIMGSIVTSLFSELE